MPRLFGEFVSQALKIRPVPLRADTCSRRDRVTKKLHADGFALPPFQCFVRSNETRTFILKIEAPHILENGVPLPRASSAVIESQRIEGFCQPLSRKMLTLERRDQRLDPIGSQAGSSSRDFKPFAQRRHFRKQEA